MILYEIISSSASALFAVLNVSAFLLSITLALVLHEISHGYVALLNGDPTAKMYGRLTLNPAKHFNLIGFIMLILLGFGFARPVPIDSRNFKNEKKGKILVSLAGVVTNLLCAFIFVLVFLLLARVVLPNMLGNGYWVTWNFWNYLAYFVYEFSIWFVTISINFALFNILIFYPLDGYRLLECLVPSERGFMIFLRRYSMPMIILLIIIGNVAPNYSPLNLYITNAKSGILWLFTSFWGLFGL